MSSVMIRDELVQLVAEHISYCGDVCDCDAPTLNPYRTEESL